MGGKSSPCDNKVAHHVERKREDGGRKRQGVCGFGHKSRTLVLKVELKLDVSCKERTGIKPRRLG